MFRRVVIFSFAFLVLGSPPALAQESWTGNVRAFLGTKGMNEDWEPVRCQRESGLELDLRRAAWPVSAAFDFFLSRSDQETMTRLDPATGADEKIDVKGMTFEANLGIRKHWDQSKYLQPFLAGGLAFVSAEYETSNGEELSFTEQGIGLWISQGVVVNILDRLSFGFDLRVTVARPGPFGIDTDLTGIHLGLLTGFRF